MPPTEPNSAPSDEPPARPPARNSPALVVASLLLLGALVWALNPRRPALRPAPLKPQPAGCPPSHGDFTPSDITEVPGLKLDGLPAAVKNRILYRLNMEPCSCGCGESAAACRVTERECPTSAKRAESVVEEETRRTQPQPEGASTR